MHSPVQKKRLFFFFQRAMYGNPSRHHVRLCPPTGILCVPPTGIRAGAVCGYQTRRRAVRCHAEQFDPAEAVSEFQLRADVRVRTRLTSRLAYKKEH